MEEIYFFCSVPVFATVGRNSVGQRSWSWSKPGEEPGSREGAGKERREREGTSTGKRIRDQGEGDAGSGKGTRSRQAKGQGKRSGKRRIGLHDGTTRVCLHLPYCGPSRVAEDKGRFSVSIIIHLLRLPLRQACPRCLKTREQRWKENSVKAGYSMIESA